MRFSEHSKVNAFTDQSVLFIILNRGPNRACDCTIHRLVSIKAHLDGSASLISMLIVDASSSLPERDIWWWLIADSSCFRLVRTVVVDRDVE